MSTTLTIDPSGGVVIPPAILKAFGLKPGEQVRVEVAPAGKETAKEAVVADRDGFLVIAGTEPFSAVEAVMEAREDREDQVLSYRP